MNNHILLVMKWLKAPVSVTQEELERNCKDAAAAAYAAAYAYAADAAYAAAAYAYDGYDADASRWVAKYFERTGENRQDYEDALGVFIPVNGQPLRFNGAEVTFIGVSPTGNWVCMHGRGDYQAHSPADCTPAPTAEDDLTNVIVEADSHLNITDSRALAAVIAKAGYHL
jgi:hypothetical protein